MRVLWLTGVAAFVILGCEAAITPPVVEPVLADFSGLYQLRQTLDFNVPDPFPGLGKPMRALCISVNDPRPRVAMVLHQSIRLLTSADTATATAMVSQNVCYGYTITTQVDSTRVEVRHRLRFRGDTVVITPDTARSYRGLPPEFPDLLQDTFAFVLRGDTLRSVDKKDGWPVYTYVRQ
jgi:hypothetical protein